MESALLLTWRSRSSVPESPLAALAAKPRATLCRTKDAPKVHNSGLTNYMSDAAVRVRCTAAHVKCTPLVSNTANAYAHWYRSVIVIVSPMSKIVDMNDDRAVPA